jgi:hypothetical protein
MPTVQEEMSLTVILLQERLVVEEQVVLTGQVGLEGLEGLEEILHVM